MLPLPLTFGLVPIFIDLYKCRSSWICIFVSRPYVFVRTLLWQFDSQIDLPCFVLYVSQVTEPTIIVIWKCIEFALLTIDLLGFERILLIAICFCIFWYIQICFMLCCHCLTRLNLEFFLWLDRHWVFSWKHYFVRLLDSYPHLFDSIDP